MSSIKEIIRSFVSSSPDDKTKSIFWAWLSSDRDKEEKEQALSEVWKSSPSGSRKDTEKALVKVNRRIFGDADHVLRRRLRYAVAAANSVDSQKNVQHSQLCPAQLGLVVLCNGRLVHCILIM